jgi:hypothetical protein
VQLQQFGQFLHLGIESADLKLQRNLFICKDLHGLLVHLLNRSSGHDSRFQYLDLIQMLSLLLPQIIIVLLQLVMLRDPVL